MLKDETTKDTLVVIFSLGIHIADELRVIKALETANKKQTRVEMGIIQTCIRLCMGSCGKDVVDLHAWKKTVHEVGFENDEVGIEKEQLSKVLDDGYKKVKFLA